MLNISVLSLFLSFLTTSSMACSYAMDDRSPAQIRLDGQAVEVDRSCRTINIGTMDFQALGPAQNLGDGRVMQIANERNWQVLVADCNTREVTMLRGTASIIGETSCGPTYHHTDLVGPDANMSLKEGADLHELVAIANRLGVEDMSAVNKFFKFRIFSTRGFDDLYDVGPKDRFNLLCGCQIFYSDSAGAS